MEGMAGDELEARGLEGSGLSEEYPLGERREDGGWVVVEGGVEATRVVMLEPWVFRRPFRKHAIFGGERRSPGERKVRCLFSEGVDPIWFVHPCPSLGKVLP